MSAQSVPLTGRRPLSWRPRHVEVGVVYGLLGALVVFGAVASPTFRSMGNLDNIGLQSVALGLLTIGQSLVLLSGGIDMSVGAVVKLTVLIGAILLNGNDGAIIWVVPLLLGLGAAIGLLNGLAIATLRAAPFIVTFGTFFILDGLGSLVSNQPVGMTPPAMVNLYVERWGGVPVPVVLVAVVWIASALVLRRTSFGWHLLAVGGRTDVAQLNGIRVGRTRVAAYVLSGVLAATAGLFTLVVSGLGDPTAGTNMEFLSITAAAVGGISLAGGRGSMGGALAGVLLLTVIGDLLQLTHVSTFYQQPIQGLVILAAVALRVNRRRTT